MYFAVYCRLALSAKELNLKVSGSLATHRSCCVPTWATQMTWLYSSRGSAHTSRSAPPWHESVHSHLNCHHSKKHPLLPLTLLFTPSPPPSPSSSTISLTLILTPSTLCLLHHLTPHPTSHSHPPPPLSHPSPYLLPLLLCYVVIILHTPCPSRTNVTQIGGQLGHCGLSIQAMPVSIFKPSRFWPLTSPSPKCDHSHRCQIMISYGSITGAGLKWREISVDSSDL